MAKPSTYQGHTYNSWGRTRGPKNLAGAHQNEVSVVTVSDLVDVTDGYSTENQMYLHVLLVDKNVGDSLTVTLYGYSHAFGKWAPLNQLNGSTASTITVADSGTAEGSQTAADREMVIFEIAGVDRIGFVGTAADVRCYAAGSTI